MANNLKHVFDFEGILTMDINQKNWREIKQKLDDAFGELKIGIAEGMAKADAEKYVKMLNSVFAKVQMPDIGVDDLKDKFDQVADSFTKAVSSLHNIDTSALKNIEGSLDHIATQVDKIVDKVGKGMQKSTQTAVASVAKLDKALGKVGESTKEIEESLSFSLGDTKTPGKTLKKIAAEWQDFEDERMKSIRNGTEEDVQNWVKRQQAMTKFVLAYEDYIKKVKKPDKELAALYDKLLPKSYDARTNLQNLVDRRAGTYSEHKEPWAKEETLKKVLNVLQNGIKVEDKGVDGGKNDTPKPPKTQQLKGKTDDISARVYRVVYDPEDIDEISKQTRSDVLKEYNAEYWTNQKEVAITYSVMGDNPIILQGKIESKKPFIIDAGGHDWDQFESMSVVETDRNNPDSVNKVNLREKFPELFQRIDSGELDNPGIIQAELNQIVKQLGYDVVVTKNVLDTLDKDAYSGLSTTYAVLDDNALQVKTAIIGELIETIGKESTYDFEGKASKENIPWYYKMPEITDVVANVVKEQTQSNIPKTEETSSENKGTISEISTKMDKLSTDANINNFKDAIISAIATDNDGKVSIDTTALTEALSKIQVASDNNDVVTAINTLTQHLGSLVGQEDTLQGVKSVLESIKTSSLSVDISPENITAAIKEALYAKDIAANYEKVDFDRAFMPNFDGYWMNQFTGEILDTMEDAETDFNKYMKDLYVSKNGDWTGTKEEMLQEIAKQQYGASDIKNDWAQVIVEAINTQGKNVVEAIKIILPKNISDRVSSNDEGFDEGKLRDAFKVLTDNILLWNKTTGETPKELFRGLSKDSLETLVFRNQEVEDALRTLGLMSGDGKMTFTMPDTGIRNLGVAIADRLVVTTQDVDNVDNITELQTKLDEASKLGAAVPRILALDRGALQSSWSNEAIFQLQTRSSGVNVASSNANNEFLNATDEQIDKLIHTFEVMSKVKLFPDFIGDNILFDKDKGFSLIDLETQNIHSQSMDTPDAMMKAFLRNILGPMTISTDDADRFKARVKSRQKLLPEQRLVDEFGNSKTENVAETSVKLTPTMDEGIVAKIVEENVAKNPATVKITPIVDNQNNQSDGSDLDYLNLDAEDFDWNEKYGIIQSGATGDSGAITKEIENLELIKSAINDVTAAVDLKTKAFTDEEAEVQRITVEETENLGMLEHKILSVKSTLEGLFGNIKTGRDSIVSGLSNINVNIPSVDTTASTVLDGKLTEIKTVLESIDNKIAKGGVINTRGAVKQAAVSQGAPKIEAVRSNMMKSIMNDYESMGKLAAQFAEDGDLRTKAHLDNLKEEIRRKRASLNVTMDENAKLREKYSIAFDAEKRLLEAAKRQKVISDAQKESDRNDKATWKKRVKDAQRSTGINAATSVSNAGDQTVLRTIGTEGISADIEEKAKDLANQIKKLRDLRDLIEARGNKASEKDRDNLSKQISKVKELKSEVDGYLKIHQKYSGDGATDLNVDTSNFGAVGTDQYWNNITAAIKKTAEGKTIIKGLNADTGELTGTTRIAANTYAQWSAVVDPLTGRLKMLRTGIKKTETLTEAITRKTKEVFTYFSGSQVIFKFFNEIKRGVQYVRDIDLALTELKKVTDETEETYRKFLDTAAKTASKVGSTIKDVVSSTADWARLGYSMEQAAKFAETTQILMNVSEFTDVSQATDTLISAVQAFGYTAETSMDVVDLLNTIGKIIAYR